MPVVFFLISLIPSAVFYFWMKKDPAETDSYRNNCRKALLFGILCVFPVFCGSLFFSLFGSLVLNIKQSGPVLQEFYKDFVTVVIPEEGFKMAALFLLLKNEERPSWLEIIVYMTVIGIGFQAAEALVYAFVTNPIQILVRGVTIMHGGYGFIMGYFIGKARKTGKKFYAVLGFLVPYLIHAVYDFTLDDAVIAWNDNLVVIPGTLAIAALGLLIYIVFFMKKARKDLTYTQAIMKNI